MSLLERIVLISRDASLRSGLAARLGMSGLTLMTIDTDDGHDAAAHARSAKVLIMDGSGPDLPDEYLDDLLAARCPVRIILIGSSDHDVPAGVLRIDRRNAVKAVADQLDSWR